MKSYPKECQSTSDALTACDNNCSSPPKFVLFLSKGNLIAHSIKPTSSNTELLHPNIQQVSSDICMNENLTDLSNVIHTRCPYFKILIVSILPGKFINQHSSDNTAGPRTI
eukprot:c38953_g1_i1 orf=119-451(-)